jgi:hypothetical protein
LVALEVIARTRFDYPIPIRNGMRAGYNPHLGIVIICYDTPADLAKQQQLISVAARAMINEPMIIYISATAVAHDWPDTLPARREEFVVANDAARNILLLATSLSELMLAGTPPTNNGAQYTVGKRIDEFLRDARNFSMLVECVQNGRIITRENEVKSDAPERNIGANWIKGHPDPVEIPADDPYKYKYNARTRDERMKETRRIAGYDNPQCTNCAPDKSRTRPRGRAIDGDSWRVRK